MKTKLIRIVRITTNELDPSDELEEISIEEFEALPEYEPSPKEREAEMLLRVKGKEVEVDIEMMKKSVDITVEDNALKELLNIFKLYNVPFKLIENGIQIDIRRKMREES